MKVMAMERELRRVGEGERDQIYREEAASVWALQQRGVVREVWFTERDRRAVLMLECGGEEEARKVLATLPLVRGGYIDFEVLGLRAYDGYARLFGGH